MALAESPAPHVERYLTIEYTETTSVDEMRFANDIAALDFIEKIRSLNDPAFTPVSLVEHIVTTTTQITRKPLGLDRDQVVESVRRRLLDESKPGTVATQGQDALRWAVEATLDEMGQ